MKSYLLLSLAVFLASVPTFGNEKSPWTPDWADAQSCKCQGPLYNNAPVFGLILEHQDGTSTVIKAFKFDDYDQGKAQCLSLLEKLTKLSVCPTDQN